MALNTTLILAVSGLSNQTLIRPLFGPLSKSRPVFQVITFERNITFKRLFTLLRNHCARRFIATMQHNLHIVYLSAIGIHGVLKLLLLKHFVFKRALNQPSGTPVASATCCVADARYRAPECHLEAAPLRERVDAAI